MDGWGSNTCWRRLGGEEKAQEVKEMKHRKREMLENEEKGFK